MLLEKKAKFTIRGCRISQKVTFSSQAPVISSFAPAAPCLSDGEVIATGCHVVSFVPFPCVDGCQGGPLVTILDDVSVCTLYECVPALRRYLPYLLTACWLMAVLFCLESSTHCDALNSLTSGGFVGRCLRTVDGFVGSSLLVVSDVWLSAVPCRRICWTVRCLDGFRGRRICWRMRCLLCPTCVVCRAGRVILRVSYCCIS